MQGFLLIVHGVVVLDSPVVFFSAYQSLVPFPPLPRTLPSRPLSPLSMKSSVLPWYSLYHRSTDAFIRLSEPTPCRRNSCCINPTSPSPPPGLCPALSPLSAGITALRLSSNERFPFLYRRCATLNSNDIDGCSARLRDVRAPPTAPSCNFFTPKKHRFTAPLGVPRDST